MNLLRKKAVQRLTLACAMWGLSFPAIKALNLVQNAVESWESSAAIMIVRFGLSAALLLPILIATKTHFRFTKSEILQGIGLGFFGGFGMLLQVDGLAYTQASTSAFLTQGTVFFIPLLKSLWSRSLPTARETICCLIALSGLSILSGLDWKNLSHIGRGEAETLGAAAFFTGHILMLEPRAFAENNPLRVSLIMFTLISLFCLPLYLGNGGTISHLSGSVSDLRAASLLTVLVGPCTLLAFLWMNRWQTHVTATTAGLIYCLEPVFASIAALLLPAILSQAMHLDYPNETMTTALTLGGGLVLAANFFIQWPAPKNSPGPLNEHGI